MLAAIRILLLVIGLVLDLWFNADCVFLRRNVENKRPSYNISVYFLALPCAATASMALRTVSSSPRNCMGFTGFRFLSSS